MQPFPEFIAEIHGKPLLKNLLLLYKLKGVPNVKPGRFAKP